VKNVIRTTVATIARSSSDLAPIYQQISQELRRTWRLEYATAR
jgi:hypothetical protein